MCQSICPCNYLSIYLLPSQDKHETLLHRPYRLDRLYVSEDGHVTINITVTNFTAHFHLEAYVRSFLTDECARDRRCLCRLRHSTRMAGTCYTLADYSRDYHIVVDLDWYKCRNLCSRLGGRLASLNTPGTWRGVPRALGVDRSALQLFSTWIGLTSSATALPKM